MLEAINSGKWKKDDIFCFNIYQRPVDFEYSWGDYMASWLYSQDGILLDKRLFPTFWAERGFDGRSADEVRFKYGDLVECRFGGTIELVYVVATPPDKSHYERISKEHGEPYFGDDSDEDDEVNADELRKVAEIVGEGGDAKAVYKEFKGEKDDNDDDD